MALKCYCIRDCAAPTAIPVEVVDRMHTCNPALCKKGESAGEHRHTGVEVREQNMIA
jgi:hypothetical protein